MNSLNKLGLTVALVTALVLIVLFGAWWGIKKYWFEKPTLAEQVAQATPMPTSEIQFGSLPSPQALSQTGPWTQKYLASQPVDITEFVNVNKGQLLPALPEGVIKISAATGEEATKKYLEHVSPATNPQLHAVTLAEIESAWRLAYQNNQPETINDLVQKLLENVKTLEAIEAPAQQATLHTKLVAASHALVNNTELLRDMKSDWVGGLIGAKNIDELGAVFKGIESEVNALNK